ncbi:MAG TPA: ATP-binding protein [Isosphaeraceae bacterium]|jgi:signal transduction histidine kinase|nr:ATP-binding protein [Isosphaeraceae bacterium]
MFKTLRTKLMVGLAPLLAIMVGLGLWAIIMLNHLGGRIEVILKENYRSVLAAEGMKEAIERMDSAAQFAINGQDERARRQFRQYQPMFEQHLDVEKNNITLPGEREMVKRLAGHYDTYIRKTNAFYGLPAAPSQARSDAYFDSERGLLKTFTDIKNDADDILHINQANMEAEDRRARRAADVSKRWMIVALGGSAAVATLIALALSRSILEPIRDVTQAARGMAKGDLDQVVPATTRDELGELANAFNTMARTIREFREAGTARLVRAQKTAQATIDSFPDPVVVVDPAGSVERANPAARRILGAVPSNGSTPWNPPSQLKEPLSEVLGGQPDYLPTTFDNALCFHDDGQERFFLPRVLAIRGDLTGPLGAAVVLSDVTKFRLVDQLKSDMVSTVSHELKTPLTGLQMAVYLLLEEAVGPLTTKQTELLLAARQDSDRLLAIVNDLLDLTRIEQGRIKLDLRPIAAADLVGEALERFEPKARDAGVNLKANVTFGLPPVSVDRERIGHVFDNLIANALAHTGRGGSIHLLADTEGTFVRFMVKDTGEGISPEHLPHMFEKFYRVAGTRNRGGAGLGLAITREILTAHNGQISVVSRRGQGTTFTFTLPIATHVDLSPQRVESVS